MYSSRLQLNGSVNIPYNIPHHSGKCGTQESSPAKCRYKIYQYSRKKQVLCVICCGGACSRPLLHSCLRRTAEVSSNTQHTLSHHRSGLLQIRYREDRMRKYSLFLLYYITDHRSVPKFRNSFFSFFFFSRDFT